MYGWLERETYFSCNSIGESMGSLFWWGEVSLMLLVGGKK